jgi:HEAT repeat protein
MFRSEVFYLFLLAWTLLIGGCRGVDLSSVPLADELGLVEVKPVPEEVRSRYGPTAKDRLEAIRKQRKRAKHGSQEVKEEVSEELAKQIQRESNGFLRQEIVRALAECGTSQAASILRAGLNDESIDVQIQCCRGWSKWGTDESVVVLGQILENQLAAIDLKIAAIDALQSIGKPKGASFLVPLLDKREDPALQYKALAALQKITGKNLLNDQEAWQVFVADEIERSTELEANGDSSSTKSTLFWWR